MSFHQFRGTDQYIASEPLRGAVNTALALERPLLVRGEPGTVDVSLEQRQVAAEGCQTVAQLVGEAGGQRSDLLETLGQALLL